MAEAVVALSLAANLIQFLDFGSKTAAKIWAVYKGVRKAGDDILDLNSINVDLHLSLHSLEQSVHRQHISDDRLQKLVKDCQSTARELDVKLRPLLATKRQDLGKREALRTALKAVWKEDELNSLRDRLDQYRSQLTLHLLVTLRDLVHEGSAKQLQVLQEVRQLTSEYDERQKSTLPSIVDSGVAPPLLDLLTSKLPSSSRQGGRSRLEGELIAAIYEQDSQYTLPSTSDKRYEKIYNRVIDSFGYFGMKDREERIEEAFGVTYQWIFDQPSESHPRWSSFPDFLRSDTKLYWITGKAGSGKSTLMKFIRNGQSTSSSCGNVSDRCIELLKEWSGEHKLIVATFFFWNSGHTLQKKREGLYRTLLTQILEQDPVMLQSLTPKRLEALYLFNFDSLDWTELELQNMLRKVAKSLGDSKKLCVFVDGLDEFDGELGSLIALFKDLTAHPGVKLCVSSRPWIVFEDAFEHAPSLMLQELTYADIKLYVTMHMRDDPGFLLLEEREPTFAGTLVENIVTKSSGVFLWVRIVVKSILGGMGHGDRIADLQRRLDMLPEELGQLYDKILLSIEPFYLEHAAQLFKLVDSSSTPPSLLQLSFADDEENWRTVIEKPVASLTTKEVRLHEETMRRRINSRCQGFLELRRLRQPLPDGPVKENWDLCTVQYLHRTVKDYIENPDVWRKFDSVLTTSYDPHLRHCVGLLAAVKMDSADTLQILDENSTFWSRIDQFLAHASKTTPVHEDQVLKLMDDLNKSCAIIAQGEASMLWESQRSSKDRLDRLESGQWVAFHPFASCRTPFSDHFLSLAIRYSIPAFVENRAHRGCLVQKQRMSGTSVYPLLLDAVTFPQGLKLQFVAIPDPEIVSCLLRHGADPNYKIAIPDVNLESVWWYTLRQISWIPGSRYGFGYDDKGRVNESRALQVCRVFLQHGAGRYSTSEREELLNMLYEVETGRSTVERLLHREKNGGLITAPTSTVAQKMTVFGEYLLDWWRS